MKQVTSARGQNTRKGGSDPTLCGFQPPKTSWGRSRPPRAARGRVLSACRDRSKEFVMQSGVQVRKRAKGEDQLSLLKAPSKQPKTTTLQVRVEEEVKLNLDKYAEFIGANASYVVSEALRCLFKRDDEFKRWLSEHPTNINQEQPEETLLRRPRNRHETSFNPIRYAREYSVLKTACPALCNALDPESIREAVRHLTGGGTAHTRHHSLKHPPLALRTMPRTSRPQRERKATESTF